MGDWPLRGRTGRIGRSIPYTVVGTANAANTKGGSWTELTASTAVGGFHDIILMGNDQAGDILVDIAIGAAGSEVIVVSNLYHCIPSTSYGLRKPSYIRIPIYIPAGTRISAKSQSTYVGTNDIVLASTVSEVGGFGAENQLAVCRTYGADTSDSGGTSIDPGSTANTEGAWTEISSSLEFDVKGIMLAAGGYNATRSTCTWGVDIGVGSAGSEVEIIDYLTITAHSSGDQVCPMYTELLEVNIPKGSRLVVRAQCTITDSTDRLFDAIIYAFS